MISTANAALTAPMPPRTLVNHKSKQCAQIVPGDECGDVVLPTDWEYLDSGGKCPENYTTIELHPDWVHFKTTFCCSEGHSGSPGDCQDVISQQAGRKCAFVDDIQKCSSLPEGWEAWGKDCPVDFEWQEEVVACASSENNPTDQATGGTPAGAVSSNEQQPTPPPAQSQTTTTPYARNPLFPCGSVGLALIVVLWLRGRGG